MDKIYRTIGLMSGTSMDGIDISYIETNGENIIKNKKFFYQEYSDEFRNKLSKLVQSEFSAKYLKEIENEFTFLNYELVKKFIEENNIEKVDLIGFHGHTIAHDPEKKISWQIGNKYYLEKLLNIKVINDFRIENVIEGGQGAPLVPIYHYNLFSNLEFKHLGVLNIGGVANITCFIKNNLDSIIGFDICFGNAPLDDLVKKKLNINYDKDGNLANMGNIDYNIANSVISENVFYKNYPKSLDRNDYNYLFTKLSDIKLEDALATLIYIFCKILEKNLQIFKLKPEKIIICGGGRRNKFLIKKLSENIPDIEFIDIDKIELDGGFNGDAIEAEAFAFLAVRKDKNLPIFFRNTTGPNNI